MDTADEFARGLDTLLDHHAGDIGYLDVELILQARAQDMRECAYADGDERVITADDIKGWADE